MSKYSFQDQRLIIQDEGINIDEPFSPMLIPAHALHGKLLNDDTLLLIRQLEYALERRGVRTGEFKILYPDGKLKHRCYYLEGELHGPSLFYSPEGVETASAWYHRGKREGLCLWHDRSGALYSRQYFLHGMWEGKQEYYYPDGSVKSLLYFREGILTQAKAFNPDGSLERTFL